MRFLFSVIDSATGTATKEEMSAIDAFNAQLRATGAFIFACGLSSLESALVIDNRNGVNHVSEGPLHDSHEYISGFWIIEAKSADEARSLATSASLACNRRVELRALL